MSRFNWSACCLLAGLLLVGVAAIPTAYAHEARPAYLEIDEVVPGHYNVLWRTPM